MMTFDQIKSSYEAYLEARDVSEVVEWTERKETEDDGGSKGETE